MADAGKRDARSTGLDVLVRLASFDRQSRSMEFVCSTDAIDSHGTKIEQDWRLERYAKNPVVLFAHDRGSLPIGKASNVRVENGKLCARIELLTEKAAPLAEQVLAQWEEGSCRAVSVGFWPAKTRWERVSDTEEILVLCGPELRELSIVPVPSNPDAMARSEATDAELERLRSEKHFPDQGEQSAAGREGLGTMDPKEEVQLRTALSEREASLTKKDAEIAKLTGEVEALRASEGTVKAEATRLQTVLADAEKRAVAAEERLVRAEIEAAFGKNVDPAEADHLVKLSRSAPELFSAEMKRRATRDDGLTRKVIETQSSGSPEDELTAALARHGVGKAG